MPYVPINGLHMIAVEIALLLAVGVLAYIWFCVGRHQFTSPHWLDAILAETWRSVLLVIFLALVGRAVLLPRLGIPAPRVNDEYSYLLMGDTFGHFRLSNPTPAAWQHFETFHVNVIPTYHSKYPVSQGLVLAFGKIVFHQPWIGVYLSTALLCGAICWTLQAFVPPGWALICGLMAVFRFALFSYWANSYWGGSLAALGGALALGAVIRLFREGASSRCQAALSSVFAVALLLLATSRPFEGFAFSLPLIAYFGYRLVCSWFRDEVRLGPALLPFLAIGLAGLFWMGYYNVRTTGNPLLMPYVVNERTYASIPLFLGQHVHNEAPAHDPVFAKYYQVEAEEHGLADTHSPSSLLLWETERFAVNWFFYVGIALSLPLLVGLLVCLRHRKLWVVVASFLTTASAIAVCSFTQVHYFAPAAISVYVFIALGLEYLWEQPGRSERAFVVAALTTALLVSVTRQSSASAMNSKFLLPDTRELIAKQLENRPGHHLVLVSYDMERHYPGDELVHNWADFDSQKILWARSKGAGHDSDLCDAYSDRTFWSVTTDDVSYSLQPLHLCDRR